MINFTIPSDWKVLELGGGANRHPRSNVNVDVRMEPGVDFTVDFNKPEWSEISSNEFDMVLSIFCLEHISWRNIPNFLKQTFRVVKSGGKVLFVIPNTQAQMQHILSKPEFDGDEGSMLFGTLDYPENSHRAAFSPVSATKLFTEAGFVNIVVTPFGALKTDMVVEAFKPKEEIKETTAPNVYVASSDSTESKTASYSVPAQIPVTPVPVPVQPVGPRKSAEEIYNHDYFENYQGNGFLWDYPSNYIIAQKILAKNPTSVLELGCARGYVLKRLHDAGISCVGLEVSNHALLTSVYPNVFKRDITKDLWWSDPVMYGQDLQYDLAVSISVLEHIPEENLPFVVNELKKSTKRGIHAVTLEGNAITHDSTRTTLKPIEFWKSILPEGHEVVDIKDMIAGTIPDSHVKGDGKIRLNLGCAFTMFYGWHNIDVIDAEMFANTFRYLYSKHDLRNSIPYNTGVVDSIFMHHVLEHFTYDEIIKILKDCRRIIRPDGAMRIAVPNTSVLINKHIDNSLKELDEMNHGCAKAKTNTRKLWSILGEGHKSFLDYKTLQMMLEEAGWNPHSADFGVTNIPAVKDILKGTTEMHYGNTSLFVDAIPKLGN